MLPRTDDIFGDLPTLESDRLILRKLTVDDARDVFTYASDPEVTRYLLWDTHATVDHSVAFITMAIDRYLNRQFAPWAIYHKQDRRVIGTCDYIAWDYRHGRAEIGYAISADYWGRGLMPEAARTIIAWGFSVKKLNRIQAYCDVDNIASARVLEKVGMQFEGILRQFLFQRNAYRDVKMYSILRRDLPGKSRR